jgi:hypothetical protein
MSLLTVNFSASEEFNASPCAETFAEATDDVSSVLVDCVPPPSPQLGNDSANMNGATAAMRWRHAVGRPRCMVMETPILAAPETRGSSKIRVNRFSASTSLRQRAHAPARDMLAGGEALTGVIRDEA